VSPAATPGGWNWLWLLAGFVALTFLAFSPSLGGVFVFDDYHLPFSDPNAAEAPWRFWIGGVRPVLVATYWANFLLSGTQPLSYHVVNLLLHAGAGVLVFFILDRVLEISGLKDGRRRWYALFGAALFLLHPLQTESVDYIAGRSELVAGFLFFAAWLVFLRSFEGAVGFGRALAILVLAGAAVLGKESAICLPAILIATDLFWPRDGLVAQFRRRLKLYVPFVVGGVLGALYILRGLTTGGAGTSAGVSPLSYALTQCKVILIYIRLFLIPVGQNGDWQLPFYHSLTTGGAWIYVVLMAALLGGIAWLYRRDRLSAFGLLIFLLMLAPTSSVVPIKDALAERRMYVPIVGLILATVALALRLRLSAATLKPIAVGVVVCVAFLCWHRSQIWVSDVTFWRDSAIKNPANARAYYGLGVALMKSQKCAAAIPEFVAARSRDSGNYELVWDLASAYECNRQPEMAVSLLHSFAAARPSASSYNRLAYVEASLGHTSQALEAIENALRLDPNNATSFAYRGLAKVALSDFSGADVDFQRALEIEPDNKIALHGLDLVASKQ
jgi:tetratricopeptide (TPR) repeat protein